VKYNLEGANVKRQFQRHSGVEGEKARLKVKLPLAKWQ
jgi:hypothetical protein